MYRILALSLALLFSTAQCLLYQPRVIGNPATNDIHIVYYAPLNTEIVLHYKLNAVTTSTQMLPITAEPLLSDVQLQYQLAQANIGTVLDTQLYRTAAAAELKHSSLPYTHEQSIHVDKGVKVLYSFSYMNNYEPPVEHTNWYIIPENWSTSQPAAKAESPAQQADKAEPAAEKPENPANTVTAQPLAEQAQSTDLAHAPAVQQLVAHKSVPELPLQHVEQPMHQPEQQMQKAPVQQMEQPQQQMPMQPEQSEMPEEMMPMTPPPGLVCLPVQYTSNLIQSAGGQHILLHTLNETLIPDWVDLHYQIENQEPQNIRLSPVNKLHNQFLVHTLHQLNIDAAVDTKYSLAGRTLLNFMQTNYFTHNYPMVMQPGQQVQHSYTMCFSGLDCNTEQQTLQQPKLRQPSKPHLAASCLDLLYSHRVNEQGAVEFRNMNAYKYPMPWVDLHVIINNGIKQNYRMHKTGVIESVGDMDIELYEAPKNAVRAKDGDTVQYSFTMCNMADDMPMPDTELHAAPPMSMPMQQPMSMPELTPEQMKMAAQLDCDTSMFQQTYHAPS